MVATLSASFVGQRIVVAKSVQQRRSATVCKVTASADNNKPLKVAVAGAVSLGLVMSSVNQAAFALSAEDLYKKVEPVDQKSSKTRFAGTEVEAIREAPKKAPATKPAPASTKSAPAAKSAPAPAKKKAEKKSDSSAATSGAVAAVVALGGLFAANASRGDGSSSSSSSSSSKPSSSGGASDADANAADAQKWIDDWKGDMDTPEGRAADAQKWIDAWKKTV